MAATLLKFNPSEAFSEHLATIEIAIMNLQNIVDDAIAQVTPGDVSWSDVHRLASVVQALRLTGLVTK